MEIAVIGSPDFVVGFRLAGIRRVQETTSDDFESTIQATLNKKDIGIVIVSSKDVERLPATLRNKLVDSTTPVVIPVGIEKGEMRDKVRRAIGIDLYRGE